MENRKDFVFIYETRDKSINHKGDNFIIVKGSDTGHCCFTHSIIDTSKGNDGEHWNLCVCETFDENSAIKICYALNNCKNGDYILITN